MANFGCLSDVFTWARIKGLLACPGSKAGSLLRPLARDEWDTTEIDDIANVAPDDFDHMLENWLYCSYPGNAELDEAEFVDTTLDEPPGPILLGAARAMHQACRIECKLAWTRDDTDAYTTTWSRIPRQLHRAPTLLLSCMLRSHRPCRR